MIEGISCSSCYKNRKTVTGLALNTRFKWQLSNCNYRKVGCLREGREKGKRGVKKKGADVGVL